MTNVSSPCRYGSSQHGSSNGTNSNLKRGAINNSLLDLVTDSGSVLGYSLGGYTGAQDKPSRRGSVGSLGECRGDGGVVDQNIFPQYELGQLTCFELAYFGRWLQFLNFLPNS